MPYLIAAVVVLAVLCVLNLMLTTAVVRRLRVHSEQLAGTLPARAGTALPVGAPAPGFAATSVDGAAVSSDRLSGAASLLGFFSTGCSSCAEQLPVFVAHAGAFPGGRERVVAVVTGEGGEAERLVGELRAVATVITENGPGGLRGRYEVGFFPTFYALDDRGRIASAGHSARELPAPLPA